MSAHVEEALLDALYRLNLLDTAPSENFDRITRMASQIFGLPIAPRCRLPIETGNGSSRVSGFEHWSIPRDKAPCAQVTETAQTVLINDMQADSCYRTSIGQARHTLLRWRLADHQLRPQPWRALRSCAEPREASEQEMKALADLAEMVMAQIELQHAFGRPDPLSGLPNRTQFLDDLADLGRDHGQRRLAVFVDLARH